MMDSSSYQVVECVESPKNPGLNISERRELIHALSNQPEEASELLNSWSRNEIMKIICAEMGKKRNYTGLNKPKLIQNLLNLVSRPLGETSFSDRRNSRKKQKMTSYIVCCENLACRAALGNEDTFCRRCSCCICNNFDDNKDPSLWLSCEGCELSCHVECSLKQERCEGGRGGLDGRFCCEFCGKDNDLLGCWRKQVKVAKETRRVDVSKRSKSRTATVSKKPEINVANVVGDKDLGHIVKTIRCLEQEGHIDKSFRERFLTWYSSRATHREVRIVKLFVETFMEDMSSLGQQLVDTFTECILSKRSSTSGVVPAGICLKLWH